MQIKMQIFLLSVTKINLENEATLAEIPLRAGPDSGKATGMNIYKKAITPKYQKT